MFSGRFRFKVLQDGEISTPGYDWGPHHIAKHQAAHATVSHVPGHSAWCGIGSQIYQPSRYYVIRHLSEPSERGYRWGEIVEDREPGSRWAAALAELVEKADAMEAFT